MFQLAGVLATLVSVGRPSAAQSEPKTWRLHTSHLFNTSSTTADNWHKRQSVSQFVLRSFLVFRTKIARATYSQPLPP